MNFQNLIPLELLQNTLHNVQLTVSSTSTYIQIVTIAVIYFFAYWVSSKIVRSVGLTNTQPSSSTHPIRKLAYRLGGMFYPFLAILFLRISLEIMGKSQHSLWLMNTAMTVAVLLFFNSIVRAFVQNPFSASLFRMVGLPLLFLHLVGVLPTVIAALEAISLNVGNVKVSAYGIARATVFGGFLFWLGRASNEFGQDIIRKQRSFDVRTREVFSKLFEVFLFCVICLLLLNVMGINLTTLAVFGGAVGVGLGLGLQSIASNFISGIIILLDRSLTIGDFVELEGGSKGFVREFRMRYAVIETYDGKDILVPNEKFISSLLTNWTHKDPKQRYRVDFSVPYATDVRSMVDFIKAAVAEHPQVISGPEIPVEDRPDCEIDSFGDSGINMFVEFWMEGVDDGKNRVGGDLMLIILETLKANGIDMPFPQREVKILGDRPYRVS